MSVNSSTASVRTWRKARRAKQLCLLCDNISPSKNHCDACAVRINPQIRRKHIPEQLKDVDWTKSLTTLARELGVHRITARKYRRLCQPQSKAS